MVERAGFSKFSAPDVVVNVNARQRVNVTMQVGAITESVEVSGVAAALEADSSEHGQVVQTQQIVELPLNGRNYMDLVVLAPGVYHRVGADEQGWLAALGWVVLPSRVFLSASANSLPVW